MPLSDHEQRILEEIEKRLQEEDPRLAQAVARSSPHDQAARRVRWGVLGFTAGFVMLMLFMVSLWIALAGFGLMLVSAMLVYRQFRRMSGAQIEAYGSGGRFSLGGMMARMTERFRGPSPGRAPRTDDEPEST